MSTKMSSKPTIIPLANPAGALRSMSHGRINNLPKPRIIGGRVSALDRLHIKQAEMAIRDGKPVPQHIINRSDERSRK